MAAMRRPSGLSAADRTLWHAWARRTQVAPLPGRALEPAPPAPKQTPGMGDAAPPGAGPATTPKPIPARPVAPIQVGVAPAGIDERRWRALRRGRTRPERTLDLHGYRAAEAHEAVRLFLRQAVADELRCVAIVTGRGSSPEGGVLRRELPHWLNAPELRSLLLGAAHPHAANAGAVHCLLRRAERAAPAARVPPAGRR
jgi:DNA-nicking Smr family endonuclease